MKCRERLIDEERLIVFKEYWSLGSRDKRAYFINSAIEMNPKKSQKTDLVKKNREVTCKYHFYIRNKRILEADFKLTCDGGICCCHGNGAREKDDAYW
jgi:hypothetical protein